MKKYFAVVKWSREDLQDVLDELELEEELSEEEMEELVQWIDKKLPDAVMSYCWDALESLVTLFLGKLQRGKVA